MINIFIKLVNKFSKEIYDEIYDGEKDLKDSGHLRRFRSTRVNLAWNICINDNPFFKKIFPLENYDFLIDVITQFHSDIRKIF